MNLLQQIFNAHPDIQPADIVRVLSFLGYSAEDMQGNSAPITEIQGVDYLLPLEVGKLIPAIAVFVPEE